MAASTLNLTFSLRETVLPQQRGNYWSVRTPCMILKRPHKQNQNHQDPDPLETPNCFEFPSGRAMVFFSNYVLTGVPRRRREGPRGALRSSGLRADELKCFFRPKGSLVRFLLYPPKEDGRGSSPL